MCDSGRWGCRQDLLAYLLHEQQVPYCMFCFVLLVTHLGFLPLLQ
uniref:Uncharacterized protein n=1 Tax=Rhizophora mucronata TaxID=61149 RepID=A0A2P2J886_RHIMU